MSRWGNLHTPLKAGTQKLLRPPNTNWQWNGGDIKVIEVDSDKDDKGEDKQDAPEVTSAQVRALCEQLEAVSTLIGDHAIRSANSPARATLCDAVKADIILGLYFVVYPLVVRGTVMHITSSNVVIVPLDQGRSRNIDLPGMKQEWNALIKGVPR
ncbi:hypothetical protein B0H17DRAFT_1149198 [Mycena rosella]|uniref:Uncharacterized protein n=1 Tax=Mycena rosella TaxID=1033263 RepID=A0AAD7C5V5_MYCRO|nr:hypothetical protein B0H17DRAFT_1149198 [Mycena rosella]